MSFKDAVRPLYRAFVNLLPSRWNVMLTFYKIHGRFPNLDRPRTFNDKIAWRKLYDRNPRMTDLVDKVKVKEIMARRFGPDFVIPTLRVYSSADELDFTQPPLSQPPYVLKANHGSGMNIFVRDAKDLADAEKFRARCRKWLAVDYGAVVEEWAYSGIARRLFVEPLLATLETAPRDYKFHVFNGKVFAIEVIIDRFGGYWINFFDRAWTPLDIRAYAKRARFEGPVAPPSRLADLVRIAEDIGKDFPYARVDLYEIEGQPKLGEITFYPAGAHDTFDPPEWDAIFGEQWTQDWTLPGVKP